MWEGEFLGKWASLVTILSLVGIPFAYFANQDKKDKEKKQDAKDERTRASRNLYGELKDALDALDDDKHQEDSTKVSIKGKKDVYFMNRFMNHDVYDSLISSGKINFLKYELQQEVQDIFKQIKYHNHYLTYIKEFQDVKENKSVEEFTYRYYALMESYELSLLIEIPDMMKKLHEEFGFEIPKNN